LKNQNELFSFTLRGESSSVFILQP